MGAKISLFGKDIDQKTNYDNKMCSSVDVDEDYDIIENDNIQSSTIDIVKNTIPIKIDPLVNNIIDNLVSQSITNDESLYLSNSPQFSISPPVNNDIIKTNKKKKKRKNKNKNKTTF